MAYSRSRGGRAAPSRTRRAPARRTRNAPRRNQSGRSGGTLRIVIEQPQQRAVAAPRSLTDLAPVSVSAAKRAKF